jgi:phosphoglycerol transferase MdoB-like AlkP superfamily enzyme
LTTHYGMPTSWNFESIYAFMNGFVFDNHIMSYVIFIPLVLHFISLLIDWPKKRFIQIQSALLSLVFPCILVLGMCDLFYFYYFKTRLNEASFQWMDEPDIVIDIIKGNLTYTILIASAIILSVILFRIIYKLVEHFYTKRRIFDKKLNLGLFSIATVLCLLGMRGGVTQSIQASDAYYSNNPTLNQSGLNAIFSVFDSYNDEEKLMKDEIALSQSLAFLNLPSNNEFKSPIARKIDASDSFKNYNVVLVLMEGMSADYLGIFGNKQGLTPFLDSIAQSKNSILFKNAFSGGIHTNNGIFSSIYGFPALKHLRPMGANPVQTFTGFPYHLNKKGYKNIFFLTSNKYFDNVNNFIFKNHYDKLYCVDDYPKDKIVGPFGVGDDYMFEYGIKKLDSISTKTNFFSTFLTISNHEPYLLPSDYNCTHNSKINCGVAYADWSLNKFFTEAKKTEWFKKTIFIFVADHGREVNKSSFELELSFNHIPIIIHMPFEDKENQAVDNFMSQLDIFPTVMDKLNFSYTNNTMGVNVFKNPRPYAYFSTDDKIGCIDKEWLYIYRHHGLESLHKLSDKTGKDFKTINKEKFEAMRNYALGQTQAAEWIIKKDLCGPSGSLPK